MSRRVDPRANRVGITTGWSSVWFAEGANYAKFLIEDSKIRNHLDRVLRSAGLDRVIIERSIKNLKVIIRVAKPGVVIGRKGGELEKLRKALYRITRSDLDLLIEEVKKPEQSAKIAADSIAMQLEKRISVKKAMNVTAEKAMESGALGFKVVVSGTIYGPSSIGTEVSTYRGAIPSQTLRADIDYSKSTAHTIGGTVGVKVWIYRGEY
jgi:small subunit ribosomal protein S3